MSFESAEHGDMNYMFRPHLYAKTELTFLDGTKLRNEYAKDIVPMLSSTAQAAGQAIVTVWERFVRLARSRLRQKQRKAAGSALADKQDFETSMAYPEDIDPEGGSGSAASGVGGSSSDEAEVFFRSASSSSRSIPRTPLSSRRG